MTATFDPTFPTAKDRLRRALGDADVADALRSDEEYAAVLARYPDEAEATAVMAEGLAAEFARKPDSISDEDGTITWRDRVKTWLALATQLRGSITAAVSTGAYSAAAVRECDETHSEYVRDHTWWTR